MRAALIIFFLLMFAVTIAHHPLVSPKRVRDPIICAFPSSVEGYEFCCLYPPAGTGCADFRHGEHVEIMGKGYIIP